jgi:hypothetical protein
MQTLFILEYQAQNDGTASALPPLGYQVTDAASENACISAFFSKCASAAISSCDTHTVMIVTSEGEVWRGYKQTLRHGHEVENAE